MTTTNKAKKNSKLQVTLNQWNEILRKNDVVEDAKAMIAKIKGMMA